MLSFKEKTKKKIQARFMIFPNSVKMESKENKPRLCVSSGTWSTFSSVIVFCISSTERVAPAGWSSQDADMVKRNMVVADDAAFREKSKLLTSMERQKWLNSYMQKLLVVNSS